MATTTPNFGLRKPTNADIVNVATDISGNMDLLDAHAHSGTYVALVSAPTGVAATDTATIHAARDAAGNGGKLVFSAGTYMTAGLTASVVNQTWTLPPLTTIKLADASNINLVDVNSAGGFTLEGGGKLDGNRANQTTAGAGIIFQAGDRNTCRGMQIVDTYVHGVMAIDNTNLRVQNNTILGAGGAGVWTEGDQDTVWITDNTVDDYARIATFQAGGVHIKGGATVLATGIRVLANNVTNGGSSGIVCNPATFGVRDAWICDNTVILTGTRGLAAMGEGMALTGERLTVDRNRIDQAWGQGILVWGAAKHCSITRNLISNSSQDPAGGHPAIQLEATATYAGGDATIERCEIVGNIAWDDQGTKTQLRGLRVIAGGTFVDNIVADNIFVGNINTGIDLGGHTAGFIIKGSFGVSGQDRNFLSNPGTTYVDDDGNLVVLGADLKAAVDTNTTAIATKAPLITTRWIPPSQFNIGGGTPNLALIASSNYPAWHLDAAATEAVSAALDIPADWLTFSIKAYWTNSAAGAGDVSWRAFIERIAGAGDTLDTTFESQASVVATAPLTRVLAVTTVHTGIAIQAAGDLFFLKFQRDATSGADTLANDAALLGILLTKVT